MTAGSPVPPEFGDRRRRGAVAGAICLECGKRIRKEGEARKLALGLEVRGRPPQPGAQGLHQNARLCLPVRQRLAHRARREQARDMKAGAGKRKGNAHEWDVSRRLSLWITDGADKTQLIPSRGSGGWQGKSAGCGAWRHVGDIAPNGEVGDAFRLRFAVECKHQRGIDFWHLWTQAPGENIRGWWRKLREEIAAAAKAAPHVVKPPLPMLVIRAQNRPMIVVLPIGVFPPSTVTRLMVDGEDEFDVVLLSDFLEVDPKEVYLRLP